MQDHSRPEWRFVQLSPRQRPGDYHLDTVLQLDSGASWNFFNANGGSETGVLLNGAITLNGPTHLSIGDSPISISGLISGLGGFVLDNYNHVLTFSADNTYSGATVLGGGRTLGVAWKRGHLPQFRSSSWEATDSTSVGLDVTGRTDQTFTLASGQTLSGIGSIKWQSRGVCWSNHLTGGIEYHAEHHCGLEPNRHDCGQRQRDSEWNHHL